MGVLHEIVELTEHDDDSESKAIANSGKQHMPMRKYSLENDINKLFEAIEMDRSRRVKKDLSKQAMKRPMRFGPSQVSGIGISEPVSLKQALRGLCISQASEMAAVKKRVTRLSVSPGQPKGNLVEILLTPERSSSEVLNKGAESGYVSTAEMSHSDDLTKIKTEEDITPFPSNVVFELSKSELEQNTNLELVNSSVSFAFDKKLHVLDEIFTTMGYGPMEQKVIKSSKIGFGSSKQNLRMQNIIKRKIVQKTNAEKTQIQHNKSANSGHDYQTSKLVHRTPDKEREGLNKVSPASSSNLSSIISVDFNSSNSREKKIMTKSDGNSRSRSKEKRDISQSSKSSIGEYSSTTSHSEESYMSGSSRSGYRPHMSKDLKWEAINCAQKQNGRLGLRHFKLIRKLGGGDIGTVYLSELIGTSCLFAVKVMNNESLVSKKKMTRAQTEKEILEILDHPFLPTLYAHFVTNKFSCLVMEYCPGGDLHVLRQKQVTKSFSEQAARFYVAEVLLALEYLHMLGVVYRDLKPENILVREDGHIMLSDFDLSLKCSTNPTLLKSSSPQPEPSNKISDPISKPNCIDAFCLQPSWNLPCFTPTFLSKTRRLKSEITPLIIQLVVEPTTARSNSFVGTHEYLAPEIVKGEGHGSAVDWWMLGIFLYELLYGKMPFKGSTNEETLSNVVSKCFKFPECSSVSIEARDLIGRLLVKEPENRLGFLKGAVEIKEHPFFDGLNWALIRCETPPEMPRLFDLANVVVPGATCNNKTYKEDELEFEMF